MILRLSLLSLLSLGLYVLLVFRRAELPGLEGVAGWVGLFILYGVAVHAVAGSKDKGRGGGVVWLVLLSAAGFRAVTFPYGEVDEALVLRGGVYLADCTALVLGLGLLRSARLPQGLVLVHGWNPFVTLTLRTAEPLELLAFVGVVLALRLAVARDLWPSAVVLGASLGGALPVWALAPLMARVLKLRLAVSLAIGAGLFWFRGLPTVSEGFPGASLLPGLVVITRLLVTRDPSFAMGACAVAFAAVAVAQTLELDDDLSNLSEKALVSVGAMLFLAPFVKESWFVLVGYLAAYSANRGWLVLTATAPLTRFTMTAGEGGFRFWLGFAQYFPAYASLIFSWLGRKKES